MARGERHDVFKDVTQCRADEVDDLGGLAIAELIALVEHA